MQGFGISQNKLAVSNAVPPRRGNRILHGKGGTAADTAIPIVWYFEASEEFKTNSQSDCELRL